VQVVEAARLAHAHDMILRAARWAMNADRWTRVRPCPEARAAIALARSLMGIPRVVVLDEPNANLDAQGEAALRRRS
jgi:ABC-type protease/lipase transport system fused ATPase/permease subunit